MNEFKSHIKGWRKGGKTCPCCVEGQDKQRTRRTARRRLKQADRVSEARAESGESE